MGIVMNAIGQGLGQGMVAVGQQMAANEQAQSRVEIEREKLRQERELRLEEIKARHESDKLRYGDGGTGAAGGSRARGGGDVADELVRKYPEAFGIETTLPKQEAFQKEVVTKTGTTDVVDTNGGEYTDAVSRKTATRTMETEQQPDAEAYGKAKKGIIEQNIRNVNRVAAPDKYDDLERGNAQAAVNRIGELAMAETDPKRREELVRDANKLAISLGGKERFKVSGNTVVDTATGDNSPTEVGGSVIKKNERPPAGRTGGSTRPDNTALIEDGKNARAALADVRQRITNLMTNMKQMSKAEKAEAQVRLDKLEREREVAMSRVAKADRDTAPKAGDNPKPAAKPGEKKDFSNLWNK